MPISPDDAIAWHDLGRDPSSRAYEWFYFDLTEADSTQLSISLLAPNPFDLTPYLDQPLPRCAACAPPNHPTPRRHVGVAVHLSQAATTGGAQPPGGIAAQHLLHLADNDPCLQFSANPWRMRIGSTVATRREVPGGLPVYQIDFDVPGVGGSRAQGSLEFRAMQPMWMVPDALLFEQQTDVSHWHRWAVIMPRALVTGSYEVTTPGAPPIQRTVTEGEGYHDHNWGTRRPADGFQRWMWARGCVRDHAVVAATIVPSPASGLSDLRVSSLFVVSGPEGVAAGVFTMLPNSSPAQSFAQRIDIGAIAHRAVFEHERLAVEYAGFYQRRVAKLELFDVRGSSQGAGWAVAETMVPQSIG